MENGKRLFTKEINAIYVYLDVELLKLMIIAFYFWEAWMIVESEMKLFNSILII